jgi:hypothetical protein
MTPLLNQRGMVGERSCVFSTILRLVLTPAFWNARIAGIQTFSLQGRCQNPRL